MKNAQEEIYTEITELSAHYSGLSHVDKDKITAVYPVARLTCSHAFWKATMRNDHEFMCNVLERVR